MTQNSNSIIYLPLPDTLEAAVKEAISATSSIVISHSQPFASSFGLPKNEKIAFIVEAAKEVYRKETKLSEISVLSSQGAIFKGTWQSAEKNDTVIVPLIDHNVEVTTRSPDGKETKLVWHWKDAVFVSRHTYFEIEGGHSIGAIIIQFKR